MCGGSHQTPIAITNDVVTRDDSIEFPHFEVTGDGCGDFNMFSNDHAWEVSFADQECTNLTVSWKGDTYEFLQMHFHFGSEHTIGGGHNDLEVHFVHVCMEIKELLVIGMFCINK